MTTSEIPLDDEGIRIHLAGDEDDWNGAFQAIQALMRDPISGWIRKEYPGLTSESLLDVWQDTLVNLLESLKECTFDFDKPLGAWLRTVAWRRAADRTRRRTTRDQVIDALASNWSELDYSDMPSAERHEFQALLQQFVLTLPERQRQVLQIWIDGYPLTKETQVLRRFVIEDTGEEVTQASVKRALQEARNKARECFKRLGYSHETTL